MSPFATLNLFHNCFGYLILLYGNLAFTFLGLALKFCGKILKLLRLRILEFYRFKALNFTILRLVESAEFHLYKFAVKAVAHDPCGFRYQIYPQALRFY